MADKEAQNCLEGFSALSRTRPQEAELLRQAMRQAASSLPAIASHLRMPPAGK